jgi:hypothetical protein
MSVEWFFEEAPLPVVLLALFAAMGLACELGARLHRWGLGHADGGDKDGKGYVMSGALGLLALLVAFTFGMALNRYELRRQLVITEANALGAAYMRLSLLDDTGHIRGLMRQYAEVRLEFGLKGGQEQQAAEDRAAQLQPAIWDEAVRLIAPNRTTPLAGFVLTPFNEAFNTATARRAALAARLPSRVLLTLVIYMVSVAAVLGYAVSATSMRLRIAWLSLFALFVLALGVILDLDRPRGGFIRIPQGAMADTVQLMSTGTPWADKIR